MHKVSQMTPSIYEVARENYPDLYDMLCSLDRQLAELHEAGINVQRVRMNLLDELRTGRNLK